MSRLGHGFAARFLHTAFIMTALALSPAWGQGIDWHVKQFVKADIKRKDVQRAHSVFRRVSAATDRSGSRYPKFEVLQKGAEPMAKALPDGGIVVNLRTLKLCFKAKNNESGDDRLAFVLAHELSHPVFDSAGAGFASSDALRHPDLEDKADQQGLLTMTMAGFSPESLLEGDQTLFQEWLDASNGLPDNAASRAEAFRKRLESFSEAVPIFQSAVTLYHVGRYAEAIQLFGQFRQRFPSREVFHNLGISHLQQALGILALCDGSSVVRFSLPLQADPWTLAERSRFRGASPDCLQAPGFIQQATQAENFLREAVNRDASYLKARIHRATLRVLQDDLLGAMAEASQAWKLAPQDPYAVSIQAVSSFLFARQTSSPSLQEKARQSLKKLRQAHPDFLPAIFNLARMESLSGNQKEARRHWETYLKAAPPDEMAKAAAEELGRELPASGKRPARQPPIPLGIPAASLQAELRKMDLLHQSGSIEVRGSDQMRVIRIDRSIEVVEVFTDLPASPESLEGLPAVQGASPSLSLLLESGGVALKVMGGRIQSRLFFRPPLEGEGTTVGGWGLGEEVPQESPQAAETEFAYSGDRGPGFWGSLDPEWRECSSGNRQSPIDIADVTVDTGLARPQLNLQPAPIRLLNRGFDIQQSYAEGEGGTIRLGETDYHLRQFHFHTLSEHTFNGRHAPMELHVVSEDPASGQLLVIGALYEIGPESEFLAQFSNHLPVKKGDRYDSPQQINVADELTSISSFYTYQGSLTSPGCLPIVTWYVLQQAASMSEQQFQSFRKIMGNNFRPLQERGERIIRATPR